MKLTKLMMMVIASALVCYGSVAFSSYPHDNPPADAKEHKPTQTSDFLPGEAGDATVVVDHEVPF